MAPNMRVLAYIWFGVGDLTHVDMTSNGVIITPLWSPQYEIGLVELSIQPW